MSSHLSFKELMKQRYTCRNFFLKPKPKDILKDIIETSLLHLLGEIPNHGIYMYLLEIILKV